jgi:sRNA-binding protein
MELQLQVAGEVQDGAMEDAPMDKEERERLKKEEAEEKKKKEEEAAERAKEAAQAMTEEERQAACRAQQEDAGKKEDAAEEKLFILHYLTYHIDIGVHPPARPTLVSDPERALQVATTYW